MTWPPQQNSATSAESTGKKMGVVTFLKKLGEIIVNVAGIATGIGPLITPFIGSGHPEVSEYVGKVTNDLTSIAQVVVQAEALLQGSENGAQKLAAATPLIAGILKTSELVTGKKIADDTLFTQAASKITSGVADLLNSISADDAKHSS